MPPVFREDPYTGYNFEVVVAGVSEDGTAVRGSFSEAMIGDTSMDPIEYRNGSESLTVRKIPGLIKFANITLKRGYTGDLAFWNWLVEAMNGLVRRTEGSIIMLDENRQFAGGLNAGARAAFAAGAERVLLLNNDTVLAPDALRLLEDAMFGRTAAIAAPKVVDLHDPARVITAGERVMLPLLCVPRTLLRYRPRGDAPYAVSGAMGCALLVTRECFEAAGGFTEEIQVYYEDVDFCLAARARGFGAMIAPLAVVRHDGMRGFAAGLTPWAAFLKARNPWLVVRRHGSALT